MSRYLRALLAADSDSDSDNPNQGVVVVRKLPHYLEGIQTDTPVQNDTSKLYEESIESDSSKKCFECGKRGHLSKFCPKRDDSGGGMRHEKPKHGDWLCASCGNVNWNWRENCNRCGLKKPLMGEDSSRTGRGGGFNEIDDETRKRMAAKREERAAKKRKSRDQSTDDTDSYVNDRSDEMNDSSEDELELEAELLGFSAELHASRGRGRGRSGIRGRGGRGGRRTRGGRARSKDWRRPTGFSADDWKCDDCGNIVWADRDECDQCGMPKPVYVQQLQESMKRERQMREDKNHSQRSYSRSRSPKEEEDRPN